MHGPARPTGRGCHVTRILLVDPSPRGGIPVYTMLVARALRAAGGSPEILASKQLDVHSEEIRVTKQLPTGRWSRPERAGPGFYLHRVSVWCVSALVILVRVWVSRPDVVHFQFAINRRFDAFLIRLLKRFAPVVWTAHDVLPFETVEGDSRRFASIYRAVDRVIVHTEPAAEEVRALAGVMPVTIPHPVRDDVLDTSREDARWRLGLPAEGRILAALGFIRRYKGYELLADVWEHLGEAAPTLLVMGEPLGDDVLPTLERLRRLPTVDLRPGYASDVELQLAAIACNALVAPYSTASDSGVVHLARALRVPVLASDVPQLAASVTSFRAGAVLERTVEHWSAAVTGQLPDPPPPPPGLLATGEAHLRAYDSVLRQSRP